MQPKSESESQIRIWKSHVTAHWPLDIYLFFSFSLGVIFRMPSLAPRNRINKQCEAAAAYFNCSDVSFYKGLFAGWPKIIIL